MLADRADLSDRCGLAVAGVPTIAASLNSQELDRGVLGTAFSANWNLGAVYPAELAGRAFFTARTRVVFVAIGLALPSQQQIVAVQGLDCALEAAAGPSDVRIDPFTRPVDFGRAQERRPPLRSGQASLTCKAVAPQFGWPSAASRSSSRRTAPCPP